MTANHQVLWHSHNLVTPAGNHGNVIVAPRYKEMLFDHVDVLLGLQHALMIPKGEGSWAKVSKYTTLEGTSLAIKRPKNREDCGFQIGLPAMRAVVSLAHGIDLVKQRNPRELSSTFERSDKKYRVVFEAPEPMLVYVPAVRSNSGPITTMVSGFIDGKEATSDELPPAQVCREIMSMALEASGLEYGTGVWHDIFSRSNKPRPQNLMISHRNNIGGGVEQLHMVPIDPYAESSLDF